MCDCPRCRPGAQPCCPLCGETAPQRVRFDPVVSFTLRAFPGQDGEHGEVMDPEPTAVSYTLTRCSGCLDAHERPAPGVRTLAALGSVTRLPGGHQYVQTLPSPLSRPLRQGRFL